MLIDVSASTMLLFLCRSCFGAGLVTQTLCAATDTHLLMAFLVLLLLLLLLPTHLALPHCVRYPQETLGQKFPSFLDICTASSRVSLGWCDFDALGSEWVHRVHCWVLSFISLGCATVMFWSKSCSVSQTIMFFPGLGSRAGLTPLASYAVFHDTCSGSWLQFTLAKAYYSLSWIN